MASFPSLCGPTHPKPSQLGLGRVIVEARSSDEALHHSPSWSNSSYIAWKCVWGHCPVEKQRMVPLSTNQMGWDGMSLSSAVVAMLVKCALNFE